MNELIQLNLMPLLPAGVIAIAILFVMAMIAIKRSYALTAGLTVLGLNVALIVGVCQFFGLLPSGQVGTLFVVDGFALLNTVVVLIASLACLALSYRYFDDFYDNKEELFLLLLTSTLGAVLMTSATHFASFFMSLELLSVPMYGMLGYTFLKLKSLEAGIKYLVLSAVASATLLMGMALVYASVGQLGFGGITEKMMLSELTPLLMVGVVLMIGAIAFKLSLAPFHAWAGDVYEGAPAPITTFLASVGKVAVMALALRFFITSTVPAIIAVDKVLVFAVVVSIVVGNLLALYQTSLKRMLAFSSVAHMGYAMIALVGVGAAADERVVMYMTIYALTTIGAFGVITLMSGKYSELDRNILTSKVEDEADDIQAYQGLFWRRPILTAVMTVMLLSMAGMPTTAGFITKMQILFAAVEGGRFWLAGMVILGSAIGLYYYLKVILVMYKRPIEHIAFDVTDDWRLKANGLMILLVTAIILFFGIFPHWLFVWSSMATIVQSF